MNNTGRDGCPLCPHAVSGLEELRLHLQVDHRKSAVVDEYVDRLDRSPAVSP
ncbi:hypothetical protein [Haloplanus salilacus]|uniref:hypothetical protein n=1 Tax=Haloplanus salilacus TaxID=2949994 RepID=UPI0030D34D3F